MQETSGMNIFDGINHLLTKACNCLVCELPVGVVEQILVAAAFWDHKFQLFKPFKVSITQ